MKSNPNKANQYVLDPRQKLCWDFYVNPKSETFGNATQSAIKAGYEESYSDTITQTEWFCAKVRRIGMLDKAEKVLDRTLTLDETDDKGKIQPDILRIKTDVAKFVAKTQGKDEGYSDRTELTAKDGEPLTISFDPSFKNDIA